MIVDREETLWLFFCMARVVSVMIEIITTYKAKQKVILQFDSYHSYYHGILSYALYCDVTRTYRNFVGFFMIWHTILTLIIQILAWNREGLNLYKNN